MNRITIAVLFFVAALVKADVPYQTATGTFNAATSATGAYNAFDWIWFGTDDVKINCSLSPSGMSNIAFRLCRERRGAVYLDVLDGTYAVTNYTATISRTNLPPSGVYYAEFLGATVPITSGITRVFATGKVNIQQSLWASTNSATWTNTTSGNWGLLPVPYGSSLTTNSPDGITIIWNPTTEKISAAAAISYTFANTNLPAGQVVTNGATVWIGTNAASSGISATEGTNIASAVTASMMLTGSVATATSAGGVTGAQSNTIATAVQPDALSGYMPTGSAHSTLSGILGSGSLHVSEGDTNRLALALTNAPTLQQVVNAGNGATNIGALSGITDVSGTGRRTFGSGLNVTDIAATAVGSSQSGWSFEGTQTIGADAYGASQSGYNIEGTQTIGIGASGASQSGINRSTQTIEGDASGASQSGYNYGPQTIQRYAYGASQSGFNNGTQAIGTNAYGASQSGDNGGTQIIGNEAYGAQQIGKVASSASATNNGIGATQLLDLTNGQSAVTTVDGDGSILLGAGTASNRYAIVAGDGQVSHGDGSITAGGGFYHGNNPVLTNLTPAQVVAAGGITNISTGATNLPAGTLAYVGGTLYSGTNDQTGAGGGIDAPTATNIAQAVVAPWTNQVTGTAIAAAGGLTNNSFSINGVPVGTGSNVTVAASSSIVMVLSGGATLCTSASTDYPVTNATVTYSDGSFTYTPTTGAIVSTNAAGTYYSISTHGFVAIGGVNRYFSLKADVRSLFRAHSSVNAIMGLSCSGYITSASTNYVYVGDSGTAALTYNNASIVISK